MKAKLIEFIKGTDRELTIEKGDSLYIFSVHDITENIALTYSTSCYIRRGMTDKEKRLRMSSKFEFAGVFNRLDDEIYFASWDLERLLGDEYDKDKFCKATVAKEFKESVEKRVNEMVGNDLSNIESFTDTSVFSNFDSRVKDLHTYRRYRDARACFMKGVKSDEISYKMSFDEHIDNSTNLLEFLERGYEFVSEYSRDFISMNKKQIQYQFTMDEVLREDLASIEQDATNDIHIRKEIKEAIESIDCKTVNVTVVKDGKEFTFKTESHPLTRDDGYYSTYSIVAKDRREFESLFGRSANYVPDDITKVVYGRKILYSKDSN